MACEINPICNFLFGSISTNLPTDTVDTELRVQMVKGIYIYRKDHSVESTIFTLCSKNITPFPSPRHKIQAYQDDWRNEEVLQWGITFQFSAPPVTQTNQKEAFWHNKGQVVK